MAKMKFLNEGRRETWGGENFSSSAPPKHKWTSNPYNLTWALYWMTLNFEIYFCHSIWYWMDCFLLK
jgi:hypothetical protein